MEVEVRAKKGGKPTKIQFDFGRNTPEAVAKFNTEGAYGDIVHYYFVRGVQDELRVYARGLIVDKKLGGAALQSSIDAWKPEVKFRGAAPLDKARKLTKSLSPEEREALLKELQEAG
jgi:hypothetical protein